MKLPTSVQIGSMKYKVSEMTPEMHQMSEAHGLCDTTQLVIYINPKQDAKKQWSTLWHEILHGQFEEAPIQLKDADHEEMLVSHLERIQCLVFRDNPTLIRNLTKVLRG